MKYLLLAVVWLARPS